MIKVFDNNAAARVSRWILCFKFTSGSKALDFLAFGKRKHIQAFGYMEPFDAWLFVNIGLRYLDLIVARGDRAQGLMLEYMAGADVLGVPSRLGIAQPSLGGWCVPAMKRLVGLSSGALRPDALYRDCLAHGAEIIDDGRPAHAGPGPGTAKEAIAG